MARRQLGTADRGRAIAWLQDSATQRNVAQKLNDSQSVNGRLWIRLLDTGNVTNGPRSGRPRSTTQREDRYLTNWTLLQRRVTARQVRDHLWTTTGTLIFDQTVRNRLRAGNLWPRPPVVRPPLLQRHRATRRAWCTRHVRWQRAQWSSVLFSDESMFALQFSDGRERMCRRPGERFADVNANRRLPFVGGSVMVWGAFSFIDRTPLYVIDGNLNGNRYLQDVIQPFVIPALQRIGAAAMFQVDNARPHRARIVTDFLRQHNVNRMDWPPYSPDLNPTEHAWDEFGRRLRSNHAPPTNHAYLARMLVAEWQAIPQAFFQRLINNMRRICIECINARGVYSHY